MAIERMKKLRLMVVRSNKDALLKELVRRGCVEFSEIEGEIQDSDFKNLVTRESSGLMTFKAQHTALVGAVDILDRHMPEKKPMLSAKPEVGEDVLLDDSGVSAACAVAEEISSNEDRIKRIGAEESRQRSNIDALTPWAKLDLSLETTGTERCSVMLGTVPGSTDFAAMESALAAVTEEAELFLVEEDKTQKYLALVCMKEEHAAVIECMRSFSFSAAPVGGMTGTARECIAAAGKELDKLAREKADCLLNIGALADHRNELKLAADVVSTKIARAEAEDKLYGLNSVVFMQGWLPADREAEMSEVFDRFECAWETEDPDPSEYPDVPVQLRSNKVTNALNMVTNMYSLPAYDGLDPNPLMAPFFILFYGLMMADMGYGLLMFLAGFLISKKYAPKGTAGNLFGLMTLCGISTFIMGALTGGFFGDFLTQVVKLTTGGDFTLPALFTPLDDTLMILIGAMALGMVQIITGMAISFVRKLKNGQVMDAVWEELTWWVVFAGIGLMAAGMTSVVLYVGLAMVVLGPVLTNKGFGKITGIFGSLYNHITGYFGDILSYSRLMALMLAGSVIAQVFNTLGAIPGNIIVFLIISLAGNALNFALNLLGCYVHDLRLQCLEYFGKFYEDGGKPFKPLMADTKYVDITK